MYIWCKLLNFSFYHLAHDISVPNRVYRGIDSFMGFLSYESSPILTVFQSFMGREGLLQQVPGPGDDAGGLQTEGTIMTWEFLPCTIVSFSMSSMSNNLR